MDNSDENILEKRTLVIGAGVSGLVSLKSALEADLGDVVCYEQADEVGGLWSYQEMVEEHRGSVSLNTTTNTSKEVMSFSDFPFSDRTPNYLTHRLSSVNFELYLRACLSCKYLFPDKEVKEYLEEYAESNKLNERIRMNRKVIELSLKRDQFRVLSKDITSGDIQTDVFDNVMVCNGRNFKTKCADFPGETEFKGRVSHGYEFRDPKKFAAKRVCVVGIGNTAVDIAVDLSQICTKVYLSTESGSYIVQRTSDHGLPIDLKTTRRLTQHMINAMPTKLYDYLAAKQMNKQFDHDLYGLTPKSGFSETHPTVNDDLCNKIITGQIQIVKNIKKYTETGVIFTNNLEVEVDEVILATGYLIDFPFIDKDIVCVKNNKLRMYHKIFLPEVNNLCFIGFIQPLSAVLPVCEMQARYAVQVFKKKIKLPSREEMNTNIEKVENQNRKEFSNTSRHTLQTKALPYMEMLAADIGCGLSNTKLLLTDPRLAYACWFGVLSPSQYRLYGEYRWSGARDSILDLWRRVETPFGAERALLRSKRLRNRPFFMFFILTMGIGCLIFCFIYFKVSSFY